MAIARTPDSEKKKSSINLHINTHLCQFMAQNSKIWGVKKKGELFDISKIGTFRPSERPIGDLCKNPNQGVLSTLWHTYGLILDEISQCRVPSKLSQMCQKMHPVHLKPCQTPQVCHTPPKMVPPYSPGSCPPKTPRIL